MNSPCPDAVPISTQCPDANPFQNLSSEAPDGLDYLSSAWAYGGPFGAPPFGEDWTALQGGGTVVTQTSQLDSDLQALIMAVNDAVLHAHPRRHPLNPSRPPRPLFYNEAQTVCRQCLAPLVGSSCFTVPGGVILDISQAGADAYAAYVASVLVARYLICFDLSGNASPPTGQVGTPYSYQLTCSGGTPPYHFYIVAGTLPAGLSLSSSGLISGTPQTFVWFDPITFGVSDSS